MFKYFITITCCIIFGFVLYAQDFTKTSEYLNANSNWTFGFGAGLNFSGASPTPFQHAMGSDEGCTSVSDPKDGRLLFYSNGMACWNANHAIMPNGNALLGNRTILGYIATSAQGACIVPVIGAPDQYYLFSLAPGWDTPSLYYNVIDMRLDSGRGDIVPGKKNIILDRSLLSETMIAIPGACDEIWLVVHALQMPQFKAYRISAKGIDTVPVLSNTGPTFFYGTGALAVSPDRNLIAISSYVATADDVASGIVLAKFDPVSGIVSDGMEIDNVPTYSVCFSPDNTKLYSTSGYTIGLIAQLTQFDVSSFNEVSIRNSKSIIANVFQMRGLRRYNDSIYLVGGIKGVGRNLRLSPNVSIITQPNATSFLCEFKRDEIPLASTGSFGIGSDVAFPFKTEYHYGKFLDTTVCKTRAEDTALHVLLKARTGFSNFTWEDGSQSEDRIISSPGTYWATYVDPPCRFHVDTFQVKFVDVSFSLGPDTVLCDQDFYTLSVPITGGAYLWQDGSTSPVYTATGKGTYSVVVTKEGCTAADDIYVSANDFRQHLGGNATLCNGDPIPIFLTANVPPGADVQWNTGSQDSFLMARDTGLYWVTVTDLPCVQSDSVHISMVYCDCALLLPNAFTPNGDGLNDVYLPLVETGCPVRNYSLTIFNRFGETVFSSADAHRGWDGTHKGEAADMGTYFYQLYFTGGSNTRQKDYKRKGDLILIR